MNSFSEWRKILLFGVIGAVGCLAGSLFGEAFLAAAKPERQGGGAGGLIFNPELTERLKREGARSGDVQVSLMWSNRNDLDLHVVDPAGEEISFKSKRSRSGGWLDVDMNANPRRGLSSQPVENVFWPAGGAPLGSYRIFVNHYGNHGGRDPTDFIVGVLVGGNVSVAGKGSGVNEIPGAISFREPRRMVHQFTLEARAPERVAALGPTTLIIGLWTGLLAAGLSVALVVGQNFYLRRPLLPARQGAIVLVGGLAAGVIAGVLGQALFSVVSQFESVGQAGRVIGWIILGGILGWGMAYVISNLSALRAALAGAAGGLVGALAFAWIAQDVGDLPGRVAGATILGFAIGLMVAIVEAAFRSAWLEIGYGAKETRSVSLGAEPVTIGGDASSCTVYARNAPAVALRYKLEQDQIVCEDVVKGRSFSVEPGNRQAVGSLTVTVRAAGAAAQGAPAAPAAPRPAGVLSLRLSNGKTIPLSDGAKLGAADIPGLKPSNSGGAVAEVGRNPNDPAMLGLKNLSGVSWTATLASRDLRKVEPGRSVRLESGTKISFGPIEGEIS
jgi:hypothetical protein